MVLTITEVLNIWNQSGVFSYVLPFLLIFAVVFAILHKSNLLTKGSDENKALLAIVSASVGLLALQLDIVPIFFASIFPRFGVGLSILLVVLILVGFSKGTGENGDSGNKWMGIVIGVFVIVWVFFSWDTWSFGGWYGGFGNWLYYEDFWTLVIVGLVVWAIYAASKPKNRHDHNRDHHSRGRSTT